MDLNRIKVIVWDLDDTFWKGTISEGEISLIPEHCELLRRLTDRGIMNSICSKNDFNTVRTRLETEGLWELFVFPSIDWSPKASRIADIIHNMSLRPANVLFIDDNPLNLNEAKFYIPDLNILHVDNIEDIMAQVDTAGKDDRQHKRLSQYHQLEKKVEDSSHFNTTDEFLVQSRIQVTIDHNCLNHIERIAEMVQRTNQLNFTKLRSNTNELTQILTDPVYRCGTVSVSDIYGDYGLVGFYALDTRNHSLLHFLFSCRTMGMGIEQYLYEQLDFPELVINGEVSGSLEKIHKVYWINAASEACDADKLQNPSIKCNQLKVLLKGPCDMDSILPYLYGNGNCTIETEFNFVDLRGVAITAMNHSQMIVEGHSLNDDEKNSLLHDAPFLDCAVFKTRMSNPEYDIVFMSMLPDCHEGVYRHRDNGGMISFSSCNYDFTDPRCWDKIVKGEITNHNYAFTHEELQQFSDQFEFMGPLSAERIVGNIQYIRNNVMAPATQLVLILGSEIECDNPSSDEFSNHASRHKSVNDALKSAFSNRKDVKFINVTELISGQSDFRNCTNHFSRNVYYKIAMAISDKIAEYSGSNSIRVYRPLVARARGFINRLKRRLH